MNFKTLLFFWFVIELLVVSLLYLGKMENLGFFIYLFSPVLAWIFFAVRFYASKEEIIILKYFIMSLVLSSVAFLALQIDALMDYGPRIYFDALFAYPTSPDIVCAGDFCSIAVFLSLLIIPVYIVLGLVTGVTLRYFIRKKTVQHIIN